MSNLAEILQAYGFTKREHQLDIIRLLYLADCFDGNKFTNDLRDTDHPPAQIESALKVTVEAGVGDDGVKDLKKFKPELILDGLFLVHMRLQIFGRTKFIIGLFR